MRLHQHSPEVRPTRVMVPERFIPLKVLAPSASRHSASSPLVIIRLYYSIICAHYQYICSHGNRAKSMNKTYMYYITILSHV